MLKRLMLAFVAIAAGLGLMAAPASASVPDWDSIAQSKVAVTGDGWSFTPVQARANLPESPAVAAKRAASDCSQYGFAICMWVDINYTGKRWAFTQTWLMNRFNSDYSLRSSNCGAPNCINNEGSSWVNNMTVSLRLFDDSYCDHINGLHWYRDMTSGQQATAQGSDWNDRVSAFGWIGRTDGIDCDI